ncbi:MAG TPA: type II toxin-antitoxin system VapC family toxin [Actinomycetota bacterium]
MIVYVDSSVLARAYLIDELGHADAVALLEDADVALITGSWTRVEVSGALVRAARTGRGGEADLLALLDADLGPEGPVTVVSASQESVEEQALTLVRQHALRAMDAWHLATAALTIKTLAEPGEEIGFASRDEAQSKVASLMGFRCI